MNRRTWWLGVLFAAVAVVGSGCARSSYSALVSEDQVTDLAELKQATLQHPNHTTVVPTQGEHGPTAGVAIHQIESPGHDTILVFIHGIMADHSAWRFLVGDLARDYDLWLVDLPGCGDSDKPDPDIVGPDGYSPLAMASRVLDALDERLAARGGDPSVIIVAHSLGGAITLRMFGDESLRSRHGATLEHVERIVLISPLDVAVNQQHPMIAELARADSLQISIGAATGVVQERIAAATLNSVSQADRALREEADKRVMVVTDPKTRRPLQAMVKQAVAWKQGRPDWEANERIVATYSMIDVPCLIIWGERDEILPCSMGYKLAAQLPKANLVCLPQVMHSPHIERPGLTAGLVREYVKTGKAPAPPAHTGTHR